VRDVFEIVFTIREPGNNGTWLDAGNGWLHTGANGVIQFPAFPGNLDWGLKLVYAGAWHPVAGALHRLRATTLLLSWLVRILPGESIWCPEFQLSIPIDHQACRLSPSPLRP
jgi:hypothetical protein